MQDHWTDGHAEPFISSLFYLIITFERQVDSFLCDLIFQTGNPAITNVSSATLLHIFQIKFYAVLQYIMRNRAYQAVESSQIKRNEILYQTE